MGASLSCWHEEWCEMGKISFHEEEGAIAALSGQKRLQRARLSRRLLRKLRRENPLWERKHEK